MAKVAKKLGLLFFVTLLGAQFLAAIPVPKVEAADANIEKLCVPVTTSLGGDKWKSDAFQMEFISRGEIKVTYQETGNCARPSNLSSKYLHESKLQFAPFVNQSLFLDTLRDGAATKVVYSAGKGGSDAQNDETLIDVKHWGDGAGINTQANPKDWATHRFQDTSSFNKMFTNSEYTIGIEEDKLKGTASCDGTNSNIHLVNINNDGKGVIWNCDNTSFNHQGAEVLSVIRNKDNFNISFKASSDGSGIGSLLTDDQEFFFKECGGVYKNDNCNGKKFIEGLKPEDLKTDGVKRVTVKETGKPSFDIVFAGAKNTAVKLAPGVTGSGGGPDNSCESRETMAWILCPVIKMLDDVFTWLDSQIQDLLEVNEDAYTHPKLYLAWSNVRNIAFIILIPIMLVMVIGTALGSEMFSAYTVKKAIPRMVAAILFISLSWYICGFFIGFFNVLGRGVIGLITYPFGLTENASLAQLFEPSSGGTLIQGGSTIISAFALINVDGLLGILASYLAVAALVLFIAFLILTIRQLIIIGLILAAPLAILAWIFPGNDKPWKFWWGTFSKLLMMYPLITGLIALGRVFSYLIGNTSAAGSAGLQGGLLNPLLKITAYIVPYLLIPLTFKFAGGAFATLTGMVNDRSRGLFDRMKKGRQEGWQQLGKNAKTGKLLKVRGGEHGLTNRFNEGIQRATLQGAGGFAVGSQRRARINAAKSRHEMEEAKEMIEKDHIMRPIVKDDDKLWAVMHGTNEAEMRQILIDRAPSRFNESDKKRDLDQAVEEAMAFRKHAGHTVSRIAATMANAATGTGYNYRTDNQGNFTGDDDMLMAILDASGGDASLAGRMLAEMRPMAVQSGRQDIAGGGYAHSMKVMDDLRRAQAAPGGRITRTLIDPTTGDVLRDANGLERTILDTYGIQDARLDIMQDVLRSNAGAAVAGKVKGVKQLAPVLKANAEAALQATGPNATRNAARELATLAGKHDAAAQIAPQNARALADGVLAQEIDISTLSNEMRAMLAPALLVTAPDGTMSSKLTGTITYSQAIEAMRGNADFQTMRREYQNASVAAAQQANAGQAAAQQGIQPVPINPQGIAGVGGGPG